MKIELQEIREFFEREEISRIAYDHFNGKHDGFIVIFDLLLTAFELEKENKIDSLKELKSITNNIDILEPILTYGISHVLKTFGKTYKQYDTFQNSIDFLLQYNGLWNVEYFLKFNGLSKDKLNKLKDEIKKEFYPSENEINLKNIEYKAKRAKEKEELLKKYYEKKVVYTSTDIKKYLSEEVFISSNMVNVDLVEYPILIKVFKNDELLGIKKEFSSLRNKLKVLSKTFDFDDYSIVHIPRNKIDDLQIEAYIKYKIKYLPPTISSSDCGNYKSLQQLKKRFSDDFDIRTIRKIIDLYKVPNYSFNNGLEIIHRDLFDEALKKFYDSKK